MHLQIEWVRLLTILPLASVLGAALGLAIGTQAEPRRVPLIFGVVVIPITFLGATYYPWASLSSLPWLQTIVLVNPLVYMIEGMRVFAHAMGDPHAAVGHLRRADPVHGPAGRVGHPGVQQACVVVARSTDQP